MKLAVKNRFTASFLWECHAKKERGVFSFDVTFSICSYTLSEVRILHEIYDFSWVDWCNIKQEWHIQHWHKRPDQTRFACAYSNQAFPCICLFPLHWNQYKMETPLPQWTYPNCVPKSNTSYICPKNRTNPFFAQWRKREKTNTLLNSDLRPERKVCPLATVRQATLVDNNINPISSDVETQFLTSRVVDGNIQTLQKNTLRIPKGWESADHLCRRRNHQKKH